MDTVGDDRPGVPESPRSVQPLLRPTPWFVALGLVVVVVARWSALGAPSARMLAGGLVAVAVPAIVVGACLERGRPLLAAAVVLACCSTVVAAAADGRWQGVAALAVVALAAWSERRDVAGALALVSVVALVLWWRAGFDRGDAPGPSWREVAGETGSVVRRVTSSVGPDEVLVPLSGVLLWWVGVGVVVGAALAVERGWRASWVVASLAVLVAGVWAIRMWRGSVDPIAATWIVSAGIVLASGRPEQAPRADGAEDRMAGLVMVIAGFVMAIAFVRELRVESTIAAAVAAAGAVLVGVSLAIPRAGDRELRTRLRAAVGPLARRLLARRRPERPALSDGVNVVGYFGTVSGLGERARELAACLRTTGVDVSEWDLTEPPDEPPTVRRATIAVVTAVQLAPVREVCPAPFEHIERTIGYFFWELAEVPDEQRRGMELVDEIWTPTRFVHDAYSAVSNRPVRLVPLPVAEPTVERVPHQGEPFVFLTSFDHRSVMARKNPIGVIEAFRRAFPRGDEPVSLVVKSINGVERPDAMERLRAAVDDDRRIVVRDESLDEHEHLRLIASSDALVSLHRSEGLGLHLAEAMWLGTPVVATRYSGNLDLMDDSCAALVDHVLVPVSDGDGAYPDSSVWADPDLDQAAGFMRRLVDDPQWRRSLVTAARARMEAQPSRVETGRALVAVVGAGSVTAG